MTTHTLSGVDTLIFVLSVVVSFVIGLYYVVRGWRSASADELMTGGHDLGWFPVAMSIFSSFTSAITILGFPSEVYSYGIQYSVVMLSNIVAIPICAHYFLPVFHNMRITSVNQYLDVRFGRVASLCGTLVFIVFMVLYMAMGLYAPSLALSAVTNLHMATSIFTVAVSSTVYTAFGGVRAVIWTDTFQSLVMFIGVIAVVIRGCVDMGGISEVWNIAGSGDRLHLDFDLNPFMRQNVFTLLVGGVAGTVSVMGVNQGQVQRLLGVAKLREAQLAIYVKMLATALIVLLCALTGLVIYATYSQCDPISMGYIDSSDQLVPYYVMDKLSIVPGLPGLFLASLFSASMSTISSGINALASVTYEDIVKPWKTNWTDRQATMFLKISAFVYSAMSICLAFLCHVLGSLTQATITVLSTVGGPLLGLFSLGLFFPFTNSKGVVSGVVVGLTMSSWITIGSLYYEDSPVLLPVSTESCSTNITTTTTTLYTVLTQSDNTESDADGLYIYKLSYTLYALTGFLFTLIPGLIVSVLVNIYTPPPTVDPSLVVKCCGPCCRHSDRCYRKLWGNYVSDDDEAVMVLHEMDKSGDEQWPP